MRRIEGGGAESERESPGGDGYLREASPSQGLAFSAARKAFSDGRVRFGAGEKRALGPVDEDGRFTNLAPLPSDRCGHTLEIASFEGCTKVVFEARKEFSGPLFKQLDDSLDYLDMFNHIRSEIGRKERT
ncbi:MAG: hypothetical protein LBG62_06135 [Candidatus Methanoplasma sp.]|nr:hypothetical protein [Candidatus Methanoplasma sp.]